MKRKAKRAASILAACVLLASMAVPAAAEWCPAGNLVKNPGFEEGADGLDHWDSTGSFETINIADYGCEDQYVPAIFGENVLRAIAIGTSDTISQLVYVPCAGMYQLSAYCETYNQEDDDSSTLKATVNQKSYSVTHPGMNEPDFDFSLIVPIEKPMYIEVSINISNSLGIYDNVSLAQISEWATIKNGGFESNLSSWTQAGNENSYVTEAAAHTGTKSLSMAYLKNEGMENYIEQTVSAGELWNYTLTGYIKPDQSLVGLGGMFILEARDEAGELLRSAGNAPVSDASKGWQKVEVTLQAPPGTKTLRIKIGGLYCTGGFYVDDVSLTQTV